MANLRAFVLRPHLFETPIPWELRDLNKRLQRLQSSLGTLQPAGWGPNSTRKVESFDWRHPVLGTGSQSGSAPRCQAPEDVSQWSSSTPSLLRGGLELCHGLLPVLRGKRTEDVPGLEHRGYAPVTYGCPTRLGKPVMFRMARGIPRLAPMSTLLRPWQSPHISRVKATQCGL